MGVTKKKLGVGIIGGSASNGWAKNTHIPAVQHLPNLELVAVSTSNWDSAFESAREFQAAHAFVGAEDLSRHSDVDLVVVSVKARDHFEAIKAAISANKAVYSEWPLGINTTQAIELQEMAEAKNIPTAIGLQARQAPAINYLKDLISEGFIGRPLSANLTINSKQMGGTALKRDAYLFNREEGGGLLTIAGGHALDALTYLLDDFKELSATTANHFPKAHLTDTDEWIEKSTEDQILIAGTLKNNMVVNVHIQAGVHHNEGTRLEIYGEKGTLVLSSPIRIQRGPYTLMGATFEEETLKELPVPEKYSSIPDSIKSKGGPVVNVAQAHVEFAKEILEGHSNIASFADAVKIHKLLDAIIESADTGERQSF